MNSIYVCTPNPFVLSFTTTDTLGHISSQLGLLSNWPQYLSVITSHCLTRLFIASFPQLNQQPHHGYLSYYLFMDLTNRSFPSHQSHMTDQSFPSHQPHMTDQRLPSHQPPWPIFKTLGPLLLHPFQCLATLVWTSASLFLHLP